MEENLNLLIKRIDSLIALCDNNHYSTYKKIVFEVQQLILSIAGTNSQEYKSFISVYNAARVSDSEKVCYLRGILGALRNKLVIDGIKNSNSYNWEELLHPVIYKTSYKKFVDGYYAEAVESAIKEINYRSKKLFKKYKEKELDGSDLFANLYNSDKEKTLLFAAKDLDTQSNKDEQEGYRFLFMGLWKGIRNPKAHANTTLTKEQAIERLIFASMLMKKLDESIKNAGLIE